MVEFVLTTSNQMSADSIAAWVGVVGAIAAIIISVLGYIDQSRKTKASLVEQKTKQETDQERVQMEVTGQIWGMAQEQMKQLREEIEEIKTTLKVEQGNRQELSLALDNEKYKRREIEQELTSALEVERVKRKKVEEDQRRLIGIVVTLLRQMGALTITPELSQEDLRWIEMFNNRY